MTYWYYQIERSITGIIETKRTHFPISDVNKAIAQSYELKEEEISYKLIQQINREDFISLYAKDTLNPNPNGIEIIEDGDSDE